MRNFVVHGNPLTERSQSSGLDAWRSSIKAQTQGQAPIEGPCKVSLTFHLSDEAFQTAGPLGSDLDNLVKPVLDALKQTILAPDDNRVVKIVAEKVPRGKRGAPGVQISIESELPWS